MPNTKKRYVDMDGAAYIAEQSTYDKILKRENSTAETAEHSLSSGGNTWETSVSPQAVQSVYSSENGTHQAMSGMSANSFGMFHANENTPQGSQKTDILVQINPQTEETTVTLSAEVKEAVRSALDIQDGVATTAEIEAVVNQIRFI